MSTEAAAMLAYEYGRQIKHQAQQMNSKLSGAVTRGPTSGERTRHDLIGKVTPVERTARHQDTPFTETPHDDRWSVARQFICSDLIDDFDMVRAKIEDPRMKYSQAQVGGLHREEDKLILGAIGGTAITGQTGSGTQSLPSAQKVLVTSHTFDEGLGTGNNGLTYWKVLEALKVLEAAYGDLEGKVHGCFYAIEKNTLIGSTRASSTLYVGEGERTAFKTGKINEFLGIQWHLVADDMLQTDSSSNRLVYIWMEDAVALDINSDVKARISEREDKNYAWQTWASWIMGAVRLDDKGVVEIACHPTSLYAA